MPTVRLAKMRLKAFTCSNFSKSFDNVSLYMWFLPLSPQQRPYPESNYYMFVTNLWHDDYAGAKCWERVLSVASQINTEGTTSTEVAVNFQMPAVSTDDVLDDG